MLIFLILSNYFIHFNNATAALPEDNLITETSTLTISAITSRLSTYENMTADMAVASSSGQKYASCYTDSSSQYKSIEGKLEESLLGNKKASGQTASYNKMQTSYTDTVKNLEDKLACQTATADGYHTARAQAQEMSDKIGGPEDETAVTYRTLDIILPTANAGLLESSQFKECGDALKGMEKFLAKKCDLGLFNGGLDVKNTLVEADTAFREYVKVKEEVVSSDTNNTKTQAAETRFLVAVEAVKKTKNKLRADKGPECGSYLDEVGNSCKSFVTSVKGTVSFKKGLEGMFISKNNSSLKDFLEYALPTANAATASVTNVFSSSYGLFGRSSEIAAQLAPALAEEVDKYMYTPRKRIIVWSKLEDQALKSTLATKDEIRKYSRFIYWKLTCRD